MQDNPVSASDIRLPQDFFSTYDRFLQTSIVGNWPDRLNARYDAIIRANIDKFRRARVLDLASHDGRWSFAAINAGAEKVTGIEVREELVNSAIDNLMALGVPEDRFSFIRADVFERREIFDEPYDVVLCLGFLYHTTRHLELMELIRRTEAPVVIIDTWLANVPGAFMKLHSEAADHPANGMDGWGVRNGKILVGHPSEDALRVMLDHIGYSVQRHDWLSLIARRGLSPDTASPNSASNPVADYARGNRGTFVATINTRPV